jgi:hypothetical protein
MTYDCEVVQGSRSTGCEAPNETLLRCRYEVSLNMRFELRVLGRLVHDDHTSHELILRIVPGFLVVATGRSQEGGQKMVVVQQIL